MDNGKKTEEREKTHELVRDALKAIIEGSIASGVGWAYADCIKMITGPNLGPRLLYQQKVEKELDSIIDRSWAALIKPDSGEFEIVGMILEMLDAQEAELAKRKETIRYLAEGVNALSLKDSDLIHHLGVDKNKLFQKAKQLLENINQDEEEAGQ